MAQYTVTITDPAHDAGITAAREAYNAALPIDQDPPPVLLATNAEYVQFVMASAAEGYAKQYGLT
jgi:hypothetical protein